MNEATIRLRIEKLADSGFWATSADVPGLVAYGRSVAETTEISQGLARKIAESCIEHGDPLPAGLTDLVELDACIDLLVPGSVPSVGRLAGFRCREVARRLRRLGYRFDRTGPGSHEVWRHVRTGRKITLPRHTGDMAEGTSVRCFVRRYRRPRLPAHRLAGGDESSSRRAAFGTSNFVGRHRCGGGPERIDGISAIKAIDSRRFLAVPLWPKGGRTCNSTNGRRGLATAAI